MIATLPMKAELSTKPPRIACATLYDDGFAQIGWHARNSLARYGRRHGYDVVVAQGCDCNYPPPWHKVKLVEALFSQGYDYVFWMDADALITRPSVPIQSLIKPDKDMYVVQHGFPPYPTALPNTGLFLIRNSDWSRDLLQRMWALEQYANGTWWENAAFMHLLGLQGLEEYGVNPERCEIDTDRIEWLPDTWNRIHLKLSPGLAIVRHYAGKSRKHRIRQMALRTNWPMAIVHELTRKPRPLDLSDYGIQGAMLEHSTDDRTTSADQRAAA